MGSAGIGSDVLNASGGGGSAKTGMRMPVACWDNSATTLPTGSSYSCGAHTVVNGDAVLFTALSSGGDRVYVVSGVGSSLVWTLRTDGIAGDGSPTTGENIFARYSNTVSGYGTNLIYNAGGLGNWWPLLNVGQMRIIGEAGLTAIYADGADLRLLDASSRCQIQFPNVSVTKYGATYPDFTFESASNSASTSGTTPLNYDFGSADQFLQYLRPHRPFIMHIDVMAYNTTTADTDYAWWNLDAYGYYDGSTVSIKKVVNLGNNAAAAGAPSFSVGAASAWTVAVVSHRFLTLTGSTGLSVVWQPTFVLKMHNDIN